MIRGALLILAVAMTLTALFFARPHPTPGPPMRDFEAYYAAGAAWHHGVDPYSTRIWENERVLSGVSPQREELLPFVGPPATLPVWSALSRIPFDAANTVWRAVLVVSLTALVLAGLRLARVAITPVTVIAGAVLALGFGPVTSCVALGQAALPAFACATVALLWPAAGIFAWMQPNVALALASQAAKRNGALLFAGFLCTFALGCVAVTGPQGFAHYFAVLQAHARAEQFSVIQITPAAIAYGFGAAGHAAQLVGIVSALAALALWPTLMRAQSDGVTRFCQTCLLLPVAMQFFHEHDFIVTFIPAIVFAMRCSTRVWPIVCTGALLCATDWLGLAQRPDGALQTLQLVGAGGLALFALRNDLKLHVLAAPAGVLMLIGIAALYAQAHPAPVWPDAMRAVPAMLNGDAAGVWHAEQIATGLMRPDGFWALLRCGSLTGCAVLAYASLVSSKSPARSKSPWPVPA